MLGGLLGRRGHKGRFEFYKTNFAVTKASSTEPKGAVRVELIHIKPSVLWQEGEGALICVPVSVV